MILLNFCALYGLGLASADIKLLTIHNFDTNSIKEHWRDLTRELNQLLLNGYTVGNFNLLFSCGIFQFLFPYAGRLITENPDHLQYIYQIYNKPSLILGPVLVLFTCISKL